MSSLTDIERFFDNVVIVDDDLTNPWSEKASPTADSEPTEVFRAFQKQGKVISPYRFPREKDARAAVTEVVAVIKPAKLVILDWHLTGGTLVPGVPIDEQDDATAAMEIVRGTLEESDAGMKYIIVYSKNRTTERTAPKALYNHLKTKWKGDARFEPILAAARQRNPVLRPKATRLPYPNLEIGHLFITFMNKKLTPPKMLLDEFSKRLEIVSGPFSLAFFKAVSLLETNVQRALYDFSRPFDLPVFMHILNNGITAEELPSFLVSMVRDYVLEGMEQQAAASDTFLHHIDRSKCDSLAKARDFLSDAGNVKIWRTELLKHGWDPDKISWSKVFDCLASCGSVEAVQQILSDFDQFKDEFLLPPQDGAKKKYSAEEGQKLWEQFQFIVELTSAFASWRERYPARPFPEFIQEYREQNVLFTKLLKYNHTRSTSAILTGGIYRGRAKKKDAFLLCITPYCDTDKPKGIQHKYKFLVGQSTRFDSSQKPNDHDFKKHNTFVPCKEGDEQILKLVQWRFYDTRVEPIAISSADRLLIEWRDRGFAVEYFIAYHESIMTALNGQLTNETLAAIFSVQARGMTAEALEPVVRPFLDQSAAATQTAPGNFNDFLTQSLALPPAKARRILEKVVVLHSPLAKFQSQWELVGQLKREYVQQIINKYLVYHSRAGVNELYYKEHPGAFIKMLDVR